MKTNTAFLIGLLATLAPLARAECPGGCSGNGVCGPRDMCYCFKNFVGNDCAGRICPFGFAHIDSPKGDLDHDMSQKTTGWILDQSQMYPYKTYEWFNPNAHNDEAHFYMECSNMGICDRTTGLCECFPGFDGSACQRATCANNCNGHGVCKSISEIASQADKVGRLSGNPKSDVATKYSLWDANVGHSCVCDAWWTGGDCTRRNCKIGVDPLYLAAGYPVYDTFLIYAGIVPASTHLDPVNSWIRLRVFDYYGASYVTDRIPVLDDTTAGATAVLNMEKAFLNIPNGVFDAIDCELANTAGTIGELVFGVKLSSEEGMVLICQYIDSPGRMRLPEIHSSYFAITGNVAQATGTRAFVAASDRRGEGKDWITSLSPWSFALASSTRTLLNIQATPSPASVAPIAALSIIKVTDRHLLVASVQTTVSITVTWPYTGAAFADGAAIFYSTGLTVAADAATITTWNVGDNFFVYAGTTAVAKGAKIFYQNAYYIVRAVAVGTTTITVDRAFNGKAVDGASVATATDAIYVVTEATTGSYDYVSECSGRGLCSRDTGLCTCFKGYTDDNCNYQNILAF
ncbi:Aste57867_4968 [Aphanomyces stellatus]|uniref:Aste57867_4968 protein n=1 Tax=Aphanomyces stellatus TaxID=120398 RepID=A0A485KGJ7_9STRA|nr:hypothetical protein As57867_004955 [Aphanomyces stellatus]VFT82056.1 Aste57867_4968 [Aphanomyces stellatus]